MQCHTKLHNVVHQGKKIVACFVQSVETSPVYQININPSSLEWNEKICVVNKYTEIKSPNASLVERTWFHVQSLSCLQSFVWWSGHCIFRKKSLVCQQKLVEWAGSARGFSGIPVYPQKICQNTQKYPKLYPGILYTWNSKKVIYRKPVFKLQYTVYPI